MLDSSRDWRKGKFIETTSTVVMQRSVIHVYSVFRWTCCNFLQSLECWFPSTIFKWRHIPVYCRIS